VLKKTQGLLDGFARKDIAAIKDVQDAEFRAWQKTHANGKQNLMTELDAVIARRGRPAMVVRTLERVCAQVGYPRTIRVDNVLAREQIAV